MSYNTTSRSMRGSSHCVASGVTTVLILFLSLMSMAIAIFYQQTKIDNHEKRSLYVYGIFLLIYIFGTCNSIQKLHRCARTDPGFIPSKKVLPESIMAQKSLIKLKDTKDKHYVQYMDEDELNESFKINKMDPNESMMFNNPKEKE